MSRRFQGGLRRWLSWYLQHRRRSRSAAPDVPQLSPVEYEIVNGSWDWNGNNPSLIDVFLQWTANYNGQPAAQVEVWLGATHVGTVDDEGEFWHSEATDMENRLPYRVRYRNGALVGGFSPWYEVVVSF